MVGSILNGKVVPRAHDENDAIGQCIYRNATRPIPFVAILNLPSDDPVGAVDTQMKVNDGKPVDGLGDAAMITRREDAKGVLSGITWAHGTRYYVLSVATAPRDYSADALVAAAKLIDSQL